MVKEYLTQEFKNIVRNEAKNIKQDVYKDGWFRAFMTSKIAREKNIDGYTSQVIGDLGPTPQFIIRGLTDAENNRSLGDAKDYYTQLNYDDIENEIINQPNFLKRIYENVEILMEQFDERNLTEQQKERIKRKGVRMSLLESYYSDKDSLMGEIQRDAIINQSIIPLVAQTAQQGSVLNKFKPDVLKDLFPEGIMPYTTRRILELSSKGYQPEAIKKQIQVEEEYLRSRGMRIDDSNLARFNTFINACFVQAIADEIPQLSEFDIDNILSIDQTYAFDAEGTKIKERAQRIMRHVKDPKTVWTWLILEEAELKAKRDWWKKYAQ